MESKKDELEASAHTTPAEPDCGVCKNTRGIKCVACDGEGCAACDGDGDRPCWSCNPKGELAGPASYDVLVVSPDIHAELEARRTRAELDAYAARQGATVLEMLKESGGRS